MVEIRLEVLVFISTFFKIYFKTAKGLNLTSSSWYNGRQGYFVSVPFELASKAISEKI